MINPVLELLWDRKEMSEKKMCTMTAPLHYN